MEGDEKAQVCWKMIQFGKTRGSCCKQVIRLKMSIGVRSEIAIYQLIFRRYT